MRKVWVKVYKEKSSYDYGKLESQWKLGIIVGEHEVQKRIETPAMVQLLSGENIYWIKYYLVELEGGVVVEATENDVYDLIEPLNPPLPTNTKKEG